MKPIAVRRLGRRRVIAFGSSISIPYEPRSFLRATIVVVALLAVMAVMVTLGTFELTPGEVWSTILHARDATHDERLIVWEFRVPRLLLGVIAGGMLGLAGAIMQAVTRNGLADPGLLGVTEGATVVLLGLILAGVALPVALYAPVAICGGAAAAGIVLFLAGPLHGTKFILLGIGLSAFLAGGISFFLTYGRIVEVQAALVWMSGSLSPASWQRVVAAVPFAVGGIAAAVLTGRAAAAMHLGDEVARGLGIRTGRQRLALVLTSVVLTGASVAAVGALGFVGLIAPHLARFLIGTRHTAFLMGSMICGAALVLVADSVGRLAFAPLQIPAGIVMTLLGVPFFLLLLWHNRNRL